MLLGLTCSACGDSCQEMVRISKVVAVLLLAMWLPATQHCALEAIGAIATTCADHCSTSESVGKDSCGSIEKGNFKPTANSLKVSTPDLFACVCFLCLQLEPQSTDVSISLAKDGSGRAEVWFSTWQFARRAAPLPGAPSPLVA